MTRRHVAPAFLFAAFAAGAYACADRSPSAPNATIVAGPASASHRSADKALPGQNNGANAGASQARLAQCQQRPAAVGSADIGPSGGEIIVGRARLIVPAGAVNRTVHITGVEQENNIALVEWQPAGLVFKKPVGLQFDVTTCDMPASYIPDVVYLNDQDEIVERIAAVYSNYWHTVAAPISHFSGYAVSW